MRIATGTYEFLEVEGTHEEIPQLLALQRQYSEKPLSNRRKLQAFVGGEIYFDDLTHTYSNEAGEVYLSGSEYAHKFETPFDQAGIAAAMAKKYGVDAKDIIAMWEMKAEISKGLGTALHAAMQLYGEYDGLAQKLGKSAAHDNPMVMKAVNAFFVDEARNGEEAHYEVLVVDHATKRAGRIDRLVWGANSNEFYIDDFKTDVSIEKRLPTYQKQLSFYAAILEAAGKKVQGLRVHHWNGVKWVTYNLDKEEVE